MRYPFLGPTTGKAQAQSTTTDISPRISGSEHIYEARKCVLYLSFTIYHTCYLDIVLRNLEHVNISHPADWVDSKLSSTAGDWSRASWTHFFFIIALGFGFAIRIGWISRI
jgi:hypothetical protein